jgi:hypothetical protein
MAAKNWSASAASSGVEELLFHNDTVSLCLLVNRRHKTLRVIDFRAGPTAAKRNFVIATAKREGVEKVFTLVERDEVGTWTRLGFTREGSINAFYRRSDAWILGAVVSQVGPLKHDARLAEPHEDEDDDEEESAPPSPAASLAERTLAKARRVLKADGTALPALKIAAARDADLKKALSAASRGGRALTGFEPFGRDVERGVFTVTGRGGFEAHASWESQSCFGNSFVELLTGPRDESERLAYTAAVRAVCDQLGEQGIVASFSWSPADDVPLATTFLAAGFRRTGVLAKHVIVKGERKDAIVWSKKLDA